MTYVHLSAEERGQIEAFLRKGIGFTNFGFQPFQCVISFRQERVVFF